MVTARLHGAYFSAWTRRRQAKGSRAGEEEKTLHKETSVPRSSGPSWGQLLSGDPLRVWCRP